MKMQWKTAIMMHVKEHISLYLFTFVLFLMGVVFGAIVVNSLNLTQKQDLIMYLNQFFGVVNKGELADSTAMFKQSFLHNTKYTGLMWILGLSIIGLPVILVLLFLKGIVVGFTVGFLVNQLGWQGFLLAFVSVVPQNLILIPTVLFMATVAVAFSLNLIRQLFLKRNQEAFFPAFLRYAFSIVLVMVTIAFASGFEAYLSPPLMKSVVTLIKG